MRHEGRGVNEELQRVFFLRVLPHPYTLQTDTHAHTFAHRLYCIYIWASITKGFTGKLERRTNCTRWYTLLSNHHRGKLAGLQFSSVPAKQLLFILFCGSSIVSQFKVKEGWGKCCITSYIMGKCSCSTAVYFRTSTEAYLKSFLQSMLTKPWGKIKKNYNCNSPHLSQTEVFDDSRPAKLFIFT